MNTYQLKKRALLRGLPEGKAEADERVARHLTIVTTAAIAFWLGICAGWWLVDQYRSQPVKTMQMALEVRK